MFQSLLAQIQFTNPGIFVSKEVIIAILIFVAARELVKSGAFNEVITPWGKFILNRPPDPPPDPDVPDVNDSR